MTILFLTVGGSHVPIITALNEVLPDFTVFFCTDRDPATGNAGSRVQIDGRSPCIKARQTDERPTLSSIPLQAGLAEGSYEIAIVPADDLDRAHRIMRLALAEVRRRFPAIDPVEDRAHIFQLDPRMKNEGLGLATLPATAVFMII